MARFLSLKVAFAWLAICALGTACGETPPARPDQVGAAEAGAPGGMPDGPSYERSFVFLAHTGDSLFLVPWLMRATAFPDTTVREARAWLARGGAWESFYAERWETPPTRAPARILPFGNLTILVREGDAIDGLVFEDGPRRLEISMGATRVSWAGPHGEVFDVVDGAAYLSDQRIDGLVLDMARAWTQDAGPLGDWAFLVSGDSMQMALAADSEYGPEGEPQYRAWALRGDEERQWPEVRVDWTETQAFPPARRDVPAAWRIRSPGGLIAGTLRPRSADMRPGSGPGPLLPLRALFDVEGDITFEGSTFPVRGLLVHERR